MARWKRLLIAVLACVVLIVGGAYIFRYAIGSMLISRMSEPFDPDTVPPEPDYSLASSWAAFPGAGSAAERAPEGIAEAPSPTADMVDVFYVHPTGLLRLNAWNGTAGEEVAHDIPVSAMLAGQASAFNGCGRIYAPRYRQASILAYVQALIAPQRTDGFQALDLAYADIARAFDYFIEHYNQERPFILAGHSQGSGHVIRLLAEKIDGTPLYQRFIAAYAIGCNMPADYFERVFRDIQPCTSPTQTGCVIGWDTIREGAWLPLWGIHRYPDGWEYLTKDKAIFCVNPLIWTDSDERVPASEHAGALMTRLVPLSDHPDGCEIKGISPAHTWAQRHAGRLWVSDQAGTLFDNFFGVYHMFDYGLFWMNIRENARTRAEAYLREHERLSEQCSFFVWNNLENVRHMVSGLGLRTVLVHTPL